MIMLFITTRCERSSELVALLARRIVVVSTSTRILNNPPFL